VISRSPDPYTVYTVHMSMLAAAPTPYDPSVWDVTLFTPDPVRGNTLYDHTVGGHTFKDYEQHFLRTYFTLECYSTGSAPPPPPPAGSGNAAPSKPATAIDLRAVSESAEQVLADAVVGASGRLAIDLSGVPEATGRIVVSVPPQARLQGLGAQAATAARAPRGAVIGKGTFADNQRGVGSARLRLTSKGRALVRSLGQVIATLRISGRAPGVAPFTRQALIPLRRRGYRPRRQPRMSSGLIGR
jgi:hypothetical protein